MMQKNVDNRTMHPSGKKKKVQIVQENVDDRTLHTSRKEKEVQMMQENVDRTMHPSGRHRKEKEKANVGNGQSIITSEENYENVSYKESEIVIRHQTKGKNRRKKVV